MLSVSNCKKSQFSLSTFQRRLDEFEVKFSNTSTLVKNTHPYKNQRIPSSCHAALAPAKNLRKVQVRKNVGLQPWSRAWRRYSLGKKNPSPSPSPSPCPHLCLLRIFWLHHSPCSALPASRVKLIFVFVISFTTKATWPCLHASRTSAGPSIHPATVRGIAPPPQKNYIFFSKKKKHNDTESPNIVQLASGSKPISQGEGMW